MYVCQVLTELINNQKQAGIDTRMANQARYIRHIRCHCLGRNLTIERILCQHGHKRVVRIHGLHDTCQRGHDGLTESSGLDLKRNRQ